MKKFLSLIPLILCVMLVLATFFKPMVFQSIGSLLTYRTGLLSLNSPDAKQGTVELKANDKYQVDVLCDSLGVPAIYGKDANSVAFGLGYMHAQDRYFQMELISRMVQGKLAELLGEQVVSSDIFWQPYEFEAKAKQLLEEIRISHPETYDYLNAYAEGVNYCLQNENSSNQAPEYCLMGVQPRKWETHYTFMLTWYMSYALTYSDTHTNRQQEIDNMPGNLFSAFFKVNTSSYNYILPDTTYMARQYIKEIKSVTPEDSVTPSRAISYREKELSRSIGSNNWAVGSAKTSSKKATLCNDPHLDITLPNPWYEAQLYCPEFHVSGFSIPCFPYIVSGHNENIAWGVTNGEWDVVDRYLLKINPANSRQYYYEGKWTNLTEKEFTIHKKDNTDTIIKMQYCRFGKVFTENGKTYAQKWYPAAKESPVLAFQNLSTSKNWNDFKAALRTYSYPSQNFAYADKKGNVGIICAGKLPLKPAGFNGGVLDGTKAAPENFVYFDDLPQYYNPPRGFVSSANQIPANANYYFGTDWTENFRAKRINQLLSGSNSLSIEDLQAIQADRTDLSVFELKKIIARYENNSRLWELLEPLKKWNGNISSDSHEALLYKAFTLSLQQKMQELLQRKYQVSSAPDLSNVYRFLMEHDSFNMKDSTILCNKLLDEILVKCKNMLIEAYGNDFSKSTYDLNTLYAEHLLRIPGFGETVSDAGGNGNTPNVNVYGVHGPSMRTIIEMGDTINACYILAGGQSGRWNSSNYSNQLQDWKNIKYHKAQFTKQSGELKNIVKVIKINAK